MHEIRKQIFKKLSEAKTARYSELKGKTLDGNIFSYHLKSLIREGYVRRKDRGYSLTPKGKNLVSGVSFESFSERAQPKIVTTIVLEHKGKYLLYRKKREPFLNNISFPYGKIHIEERVAEAANRELFEKTGLTAKLRYRGHVYIMVHDETELVTHILSHVFSGTQLKGKLENEDASNTGCFWSRLDAVPKSQLLPGVAQIARLVKDNPTKLFFEEYSLNTSDE